MAFNQMSASFFSAKNENTLALASASLDFALIKVEVSSQFKELGKALSQHRLENAESGPQHRTARRLGALFEQLIPTADIDRLIEAYGERVSEIATSPELDVKSVDYGPFAAHAGIDGTSIYAGASSSRDGVGIALHLLACMLARMFTSAEATAIWMQLVESRIAELREADPSQLQGLAALYAVQHGQQLTRDDLAAWDASARAWLETANQVKRREEVQLKLIIKNIPSLNSPGSTYNNVISNWIIAMTTIQKSIEGVPQNVTNGAVFLGMLAWHLYPDLQVFNPVKHVTFNDRLFKHGGTVTLGLEKQAQDETGVNWSISLSHLRFYGDPVTVEKSLENDNDRVTVRELGFVVLGCIISSWATPSLINIMEAAKCLVALGEALSYDMEQDASYGAALGWLGPAIQAARDLVSADDQERPSALYLAEFGRRRGRNFLDRDFLGSVPVFGLANHLQLFQLSEKFENTQDDRELCIDLLRQLAEDCCFDGNGCVIISRPPAVSEGKGQSEATRFEGTWEIASARKLPGSTEKHALDGTTKNSTRHVRWVHLDRTSDALLQYHTNTWDVDFTSICPEENAGGALLFGQNVSVKVTPFCSCSEKQNPRHEFDESYPSRSCDSKSCPCVAQGRFCTTLCICTSNFYGILEDLCCPNIRPCRTAFDNLKEDCFWLSTKATIDIDSWKSPQSQSFKWRDPPTALLSWYREQKPQFAEVMSDPFWSFGENDVSGQPKHISTAQSLRRNIPACYRVNEILESVEYRPLKVGNSAGLYLAKNYPGGTPSISIAEVTRVIRSGVLSQNLLRRYLAQVPSLGVSDYSKSTENDRKKGRHFFASLRAVAAVRELYQSWPGATVSIGITKNPLGLAYWSSHLLQYDIDPSNDTGPRFSRSLKFACLAMLESGGHNLHPDQLEWVVALATSNSIYAAEHLLQDPYEEDTSGGPMFRGIRRILGNVGYPGVVLIVPPPSPKMLQLDFSKGRVVQTDTFDGALSDCFQETSLHLNFTDLKWPVAIAPGAIDADIVMREGIVSMYDGSRWIADLDVLKGLESQLLVRMQGCTCTGTGGPGPLGERLRDLLSERLKSISNWDELLLCKMNLLSSEIGTVRSHGNWFARLAAMTLATSMGCVTLLLQSPGVCEKCAEKLLQTQFWETLEANNSCPALLIF